MSKETKSETWGVDIRADNSFISSGGDIIGRDKIIQNIVFVGQILDFAKAEGLIPSLPDYSDFASIGSAFKATFEQHLGNDLAQATAIAGKIVGEVFAQWLPSEPLAAIPYRKLLREIASSMVNKLQELHYWETFYEPIDHVEILASGDYGEGEVIWLQSLGELWNKHFGNDYRYGIATITNPSHPTMSIFVVDKENGIQTAHAPYKSDLTDRDSHLGQMSSSEFHVFVTGLVIDLIRLASTASIDRKFWSNIIDLLAQNKD
ncbi:MAG: hypothetical protein JW779_00930 [Candidatus Thorarchaeota archaeon]|nr:hypothetical protein [Candidatus Thorarchaeota archaeon]